MMFSVDGIQFSESVAEQFDDLTCAKCGAVASQGNFFMMECQADSLMIIAAQQPSKTHWVQKEQKFRNLAVKHIKCMKCFHTGLVADFSEKIEEGFRATAVRIQDKWTAMMSDGKTFFVPTGIVPRSIGENQMCCIHGIPLNTIPNQSKIEDEGVWITA